MYKLKSVNIGSALLSQERLLPPPRSRFENELFAGDNVPGNITAKERRHSAKNNLFTQKSFIDSDIYSNNKQFLHDTGLLILMILS